MKCVKRFGTAVCIALVLSSAVIVTTQGSAKSAQANGTKAKEVKTNAKKKSVPVPEPTTIVLLGVAAGVAGVRKMWQHRRRSRLVSGAVRPRHTE